jgi:hypothetical protein
MLWRIFTSMRNNIIQNWRQMYNEELHAESSLDTVSLIIYKDGELIRVGNKY